jgi:hypothetical protein
MLHNTFVVSRTSLTASRFLYLEVNLPSFCALFTRCTEIAFTQNLRSSRIQLKFISTSSPFPHPYSTPFLCAIIASTEPKMPQLKAEEPWYAPLPSPETAARSIPRSHLLSWLKKGKEAGKDFVLVDLRRTDHEVNSFSPMRTLDRDALVDISH